LLKGTELRDALSSFSYTLETIPGYSLADSAGVMADSITAFGIEELEVIGSSVEFALVDKDAFPITRVFEIGPGVSIKLYGVPYIKADLELSISLAESGVYSIDLKDLYGKSVSSFIMEGPIDSSPFTISSSLLSSGVYFLTVSSQSESSTLKFSLVK
jgi:hypothetical protein